MKDYRAIHTNFSLSMPKMDVYPSKNILLHSFIASNPI